MDRDKLEVWVRSGGRCVICKKFLFDGRFGDVVKIGEVAHIVGRTRGAKSPRGWSALPMPLRDRAKNLMLLCRDDHRAADTRWLEDQRFTIPYLVRLKAQHEQAIHHLTGLVADRSSLVLRVVGNIGDKPGNISRQQVDSALAQRDRFPAYMSDTHNNRLEADLLDVPQAAEVYWCAAAAIIDHATTRLRAAIASGEQHHISVFALARIPLLAHLGARIRDTVPVDIYQRHRSNDSWTWPTSAITAAFDIAVTNETWPTTAVVLMVNLSGSIKPYELPGHLRDLPCYEIHPVTGPDRDIIADPASLAAFARTMRQVLATIEDSQKAARTLHLFLAAPLSAAVEAGRAIDPQVHPAVHVYDRTYDGTYRNVLDLPTPDTNLRRTA